MSLRNARTGASHQLGRRVGIRLTAAVGLAAALSVARLAIAANPVAENALNAATRYLAKNAESKLEATAWSAIALLDQSGPRESEQVAAAIKACREAVRRDATATSRVLDPFDLSGATILFCLHSPVDHRAEIGECLRLLSITQQASGGWGRQGSDGDVLQTGFATLAIWHASKHCSTIVLDLAVVERIADWLIRTQDPRGGWSRYPTIATGAPPKLKTQTDMTAQRTAMALATLYLAADLLQWNSLAAAQEPAIPAVLKPVRADEPSKSSSLRVDAANFRAAARRGAAWENKQFKVDVTDETNEFYFAWELYSSLREGVSARGQTEPKWFVDIAKNLKKRQHPDGNWDASQGRKAGMMTAIACLTLRRFGRGMLDEARPVGEATLRSASATAADPIRVDSARPEADVIAARLLALNQSDLATAKQQWREKCLFGEPRERRLSRQVLGKLGDLGQIDLLYAGLNDSDWAAAIAADRALADVAQTLSPTALPVEPSETARSAAISRWRAWCKAVRPDLDF